jgi:hypothetical protein
MSLIRRFESSFLPFVSAPPERESASFFCLQTTIEDDLDTVGEMGIAQQIAEFTGEEWRRGAGSNRRIKVLQT